MNRARDLRRQAATGGNLNVNLQDRGESADILHAVCRALMDSCSDSPRAVLDDASAIKRLLETHQWMEDPIEEQKELLRSLAFCAWRAARIIELSSDAQRWEAEYIRLFRSSLQWEVTEAVSRPATLIGNGSQFVGAGPETIFQILLYLQDSQEIAPELVAKTARQIHGFLKNDDEGLPSDLHSFFLGESARLVGAVTRTVGRADEVEEWLEHAEAYFCSGPSSGPQLARIKGLRLVLLYQLNRCDVVCRAAPDLDKAFAALGMEEDRIKFRIVWAASLKVSGRLDEALDILKPLREARSEVRPALYGWVLLQCGDIHQICGDYERAISELMEAARLLREGNQLTGLAEVGATLSGIFRSQGMLGEAIKFLESSRKEHERLGMKWCEAYKRMLIAETLLAMGRPHDAESEIRHVIPVLEEQGMVVDAVAAVNLLREAIRQQRLGPQTLSDAHERLRPKN